MPYLPNCASLILVGAGYFGRMTERGAEPTPVTPPTDAAEEDLDSWRDDIALITPSGPGQWLSLPIAYVVVGVLAVIALLLVAHGRALNLQGWVFIAAAAIFILWGLAFALLGRRACVMYDLQESQRYVKLKVAGASGLCILATAVGVISGTVVVAIMGFAIMWMIRSQRRLPTSATYSSKFRTAISDIVRRAFLVEGIVLAVTSLACGLFAVIVINNGSRIASEYIGSGVVLFLVGALTTAMAVQQYPRRSTRS
jgi:hypothetical protein